MTGRSEFERFDPQPCDLTAVRRAELLRLFPEVRTEGGQIDFERLRAVLGEQVDAGRERYGLTWPGKADCLRAIQTPSPATLRPRPDQSVDFDTTQNLIIEGDNLEVLKLLQKSYVGRIKMIYIDPPYNTGNDFIYLDRYAESMRRYLEDTGQADGAGRRFSTNSEGDGRFHSKWLNMMYPRLHLARNLLTDDGVLFVSCDDHEGDNLAVLCRLVFGEENFISRIAVRMNPRGRHMERFIAQTHDYLLVFGRDRSNPRTLAGLPKDGDMLAEYDQEDERGPYREIGLRNRNRAFNPTSRPALYYPLYVDPRDGSVSAQRPASDADPVWPTASDGTATCWAWSAEKVARESELLTARRIGDGSWRVFRKDYLRSDDDRTATTLPKSMWIEKELNNDYGRRALKDLFGEPMIDHPKPPALIRKLLRIGSRPGDLVLDFFAGSGTTGHAVLAENEEAGGDRRFILVQLPEPTGRRDYPNLAAITRERVRRVGRRLDELSDATRDRGFRALELASSNFRPWQAEPGADLAVLRGQLLEHLDPILPDRGEQDLLFEILLKDGFELSVPIEVRDVEGFRVYRIDDGALLVCLEADLSFELIRALADARPSRIVCRDHGFRGNDQLETNAAKLFAERGIERFKTI